ncbi:MAG TPA: hypothetical protein EYN69_04950 [Flavobacteriales bacterium]|nr:hypothetical protein [Flavobacteriales bacterium]
MKDVIRDAIQNATESNPQKLGEKIKSVLFAKVSDALKTKKLEVAHTWLNGITSPEPVEDTEIADAPAAAEDSE